MPNQHSRLIAVAGIDGAGKSTLAESLHQALTGVGHEAILVDKHTTEAPGDADLSEYLDAVNAVVYRRKATVGPAAGEHYWLFALAAWYSLQEHLVIQPALRAGTHVVLDNSHHKILARYAASDEVPTQLARQVFAHLTTPDVMLFLRITAEEALRRKTAFTPLEAGRTGSGDEAFLAYQHSVTTHLRTQEADEGWVSLEVTDLSPQDVLERSLDLISKRLALTVR